MGTNLEQIFDAVAQNCIFENKFILQTNHTPETIPHRDVQITQVASILAPSLRGERTSNLFVYGKTGSGKTLSVHYVKNELLKRAQTLGVPLKIEYINCKLKQVADTEYRILAEMVKKLGGDVPATGLPTGQIYNRFVELLEQEKQVVIFILDEIDQAVKKMNDNILYNLTRLNSELSKSQISFVGITNDVTFLEQLDMRVRSSLSEEEILFPPYNALQIQDILRERAEKAFKQGVLADGVIAKCAALAAREHGDARRALDLLRISGEIAEREGKKMIELEHLDRANDKMENEKTLELVSTAPKQFQIVLYAIFHLMESKNVNKVYTGDIYGVYEELCHHSKHEVLTQRRVSDIIAEFDTYGILNAQVISQGRHGRTREIRINIQRPIYDKVKDMLERNIGV